MIVRNPFSLLHLVIDKRYSKSRRFHEKKHWKNSPPPTQIGNTPIKISIYRTKTNLEISKNWFNLKNLFHLHIFIIKIGTPNQSLNHICFFHPPKRFDNTADTKFCALICLRMLQSPRLQLKLSWLIFKCPKKTSVWARQRYIVLVWWTDEKQ